MTKTVKVNFGPDACGLGKSLFRGTPVIFSTEEGKTIKDIICSLEWDKTKDDHHNYIIGGYGVIESGEYNVKTNQGFLVVKDN
jgi:hypothetical protein